MSQESQINNNTLNSEAQRTNLLAPEPKTGLLILKETERFRLNRNLTISEICLLLFILPPPQLCTVASDHGQWTNILGGTKGSPALC